LEYKFTLLQIAMERSLGSVPWISGRSGQMVRWKTQPPFLVETAGSPETPYSFMEINGVISHKHVIRILPATRNKNPASCAYMLDLEYILS